MNPLDQLKKASRDNQKIKKKGPSKLLSLSTLEPSSFATHEWKKKLITTPVGKWGKKDMYTFVCNLGLDRNDVLYLMEFVMENNIKGEHLLKESTFKLISLMKKNEKKKKEKRNEFGFAQKVFQHASKKIKRDKEYKTVWFFVFRKWVKTILARVVKKKQLKYFPMGKYASLSDEYSEFNRFFEKFFAEYVEIIKKAKDYAELLEVLKKSEINKKKDDMNGNKEKRNVKEKVDNTSFNIEEEGNDVSNDIIVGNFTIAKFQKSLRNVLHLKQDVSSTNVVKSKKFLKSRKSRSEHDDEETIVMTKNMFDLFDESFEKFRFNIKIVLTEITDNEEQKERHMFYSKVLSIFPKVAPKFGFFHVALILGPFLIDWNSSSIVNIRDCVSRNAFFVLDLLEREIEFDEQTEILKIVAKVCYVWNTKYVYSQNNLVKNTGNCQHFVDYMLEKIGVDFSKIRNDGIFKRFFDNLRKKGSSRILFYLSNKFIKKFKSVIEKKEFKKMLSCEANDAMEFSSHRKLDKFVLELMKVDENFVKNFSAEYRFLKAIDRAFWLRHYKFKCKYPLYKPFSRSGVLRKKVEVLCPFEDPRRTGSMKNLKVFEKKNDLN